MTGWGWTGGEKSGERGLNTLQRGAVGALPGERGARGGKQKGGGPRGERPVQGRAPNGGGASVCSGNATPGGERYGAEAGGRVNTGVAPARVTAVW